MFMVTEEKSTFQIDIDYAKKLVEEWENKGYEAYILRERIGVFHYSGNREGEFQFVTHTDAAALYRVKRVNGKYILVLNYHRCWNYYNRKMVFISGTEDLREYECLFTDDVKITRGDEKNETVISKGIAAVRDCLRGNPARTAYREFEDTGTYSQILVSGGNELTIYVNGANQICKIKIQKASENLIIDEADNSYGSLTGRIPALVGVRPLSPEQMHGYALQLKYADDSTRNYYLHCFDTREIPAKCNISGYEFTIEDFMSATADGEGNIAFRNGYRVLRHILFYRSFRQVDVEHTDKEIYRDENITIHSLYRLPLKECRAVLRVIPRYWGNSEECYGPAEAFLDDNGIRISDITIYRREKKEETLWRNLVCVEPMGKYGYLNDDGTWFAPPIYDRADGFTDKCARVRRAGEDFLLMPDGTDKPFDFPLEMVDYTDGRYLFKAEEWQGEKPDPGYYYDYEDVTPGKWGVMDSEGNIIVEPKYVYATACWDMNCNLKEHAIVARFVDGNLRWGTIDRDGNEVIPCSCSGIYSRWGNGLAFQTEEEGTYGLMDFDGKVIVEPMFGYVEDYNIECRLITAGDNEDRLGVYSVDLGKMIIPKEFDCIDYDEHMISCEPLGICFMDRYFDYSGKEIFFEGYDYVSEASDGLLNTHKDGKAGIIDWNGNVIVPPILENGTDFALYKKGYMITGKKKRKGLARVSGEAILPEIYANIRFYGDILVASEQNKNNWCIRDTLFTLDGRPLLQGPYRRISIDEKRGTLSFESPLGHEYCRITRNER